MTPPHIHFRNYVCTHASIHARTIPYISTYLHTLIENTFKKGLLFAKEQTEKKMLQRFFFKVSVSL